MKREEIAKEHTRDRTILTVRLELDKIETKKYDTDRSSTYTTMLRLLEAMSKSCIMST